jgi:hypothetical protein
VKGISSSARYSLSPGRSRFRLVLWRLSHPREPQVPNFEAADVGDRRRGLVVLVAGGAPPNPGQQMAGRNVEGRDQFEDRVEARESRSELDVGDVGAMKAGAVGDGFLRETGPTARVDQVFAENMASLGCLRSLLPTLEAITPPISSENRSAARVGRTFSSSPGRWSKPLPARSRTARWSRRTRRSRTFPRRAGPGPALPSSARSDRVPEPGEGPLASSRSSASWVVTKAKTSLRP